MAIYTQKLIDLQFCEISNEFFKENHFKVVLGSYGSWFAIGDYKFNSESSFNRFLENRIEWFVKQNRRVIHIDITRNLIITETIQQNKRK